MTDYKKWIMKKISGEEKHEICLNLIREEPLTIQVNGRAYRVVMRTPGNEIALVSGLCLGQGLVDSPDDFASIAYSCEDADVVMVELTQKRINHIQNVQKTGDVDCQTGQGLDRRQIINNFKQDIAPVTNKSRVAAKVAARCLNKLSDYQTHRQSCHAAAVFTKKGKLLSVGEDVGRHNALDKATGRLFQNKTLDRGSLLVLSSRVSYELVQKAARAEIPVIIAVSGPTALAVELAESLGMAIICHTGKGNKDLLIFCGEHRLADDQRNK